MSLNSPFPYTDISDYVQRAGAVTGNLFFGRKPSPPVGLKMRLYKSALQEVFLGDMIKEIGQGRTNSASGVRVCV